MDLDENVIVIFFMYMCHGGRLGHDTHVVNYLKSNYYKTNNFQMALKDKLN
jgi:hypothetical protein